MTMSGTLPGLYQSGYDLTQWKIKTPHGPHSANSASDLSALVTSQKALPSKTLTLAVWIWKYESVGHLHSEDHTGPIYKEHSLRFFFPEL